MKKFSLLSITEKELGAVMKTVNSVFPDNFSQMFLRATAVMRTIHFFPGTFLTLTSVVKVSRNCRELSSGTGL